MPPRRTACYSRVSTSKEDQARALQGHEERLRSYVTERGWQLEERNAYFDIGSGASTRKRPRYLAMRKAARRRSFDVLVVTKLDRLARSVRELVDLAAELEGVGIDLVVTDQAIDTSQPGGRLVFHMLAAVAEFERDLIADRVRRGLETARRKGVKLGRPSPRLDMDEVLDLREQGLSPERIAERVWGDLRGRRVRVSPALIRKRLKAVAADRS